MLAAGATAAGATVYWLCCTSKLAAPPPTPPSTRPRASRPLNKRPPGPFPRRGLRRGVGLALDVAAYVACAGATGAGPVNGVVIRLVTNGAGSAKRSAPASPAGAMGGFQRRPEFSNAFMPVTPHNA